MASAQAEAFKSVVRAFRAQLEAAGSGASITIEGLRAADATTADSTSEPEAVTYETGVVGGVPGLWVRPDGADPALVLLYLHGGGYVVGSPESHRKLVGHVAAAAGCHAFVAGYRLAPEHPHPAALDDAVATYRGLLASGVDPARLAVGGDSAGGGLTIALLVALRDAGVPAPAAAVALSPWVDLDSTGETHRTRAAVDLMVSAPLVEMMVSLFLGDGDRRDPTASPLFANVAGLPPLYVQVGDEEVLLADSTRLAERARSAGVDVTLEVFPEMQHVFQISVGNMPEANDAVAKLGSYLTARWSALAN
jgi:epsilon-lactone hydrolase